MKERFFDTIKKSKIFCYNPQLCNRKEEANKVQSWPFAPFIIFNKESCYNGFDPPNLLSEGASKERYAINSVSNAGRLMVESNEKRIATNLDNVIKSFPSDFQVFQESL